VTDQSSEISERWT